MLDILKKHKNLDLDNYKEHMLEFQLNAHHLFPKESFFKKPQLPEEENKSISPTRAVMLRE